MDKSGSITCLRSNFFFFTGFRGVSRAGVLLNRGGGGGEREGVSKAEDEFCDGVWGTMVAWW